MFLSSVFNVKMASHLYNNTVSHAFFFSSPFFFFFFFFLQGWEFQTYDGYLVQFFAVETNLDENKTFN